MGRFGQSLLNETDPPISGLDQSVIVPPRRLHLTLGVMSLASTSSAFGPGGSTNPTARTLGDAIRLLETLKPLVHDLVRSLSTGPGRTRKVRVALNSMDTMKTEEGGEAHVLWVGPKDANGWGIPDEETIKLKHLCGKLYDSSQCTCGK